MWTQGYTWLILAWVLYFFLHSGLAWAKLKNTALAAGMSKQAYRFVYSMLAAIGLMGLILYSATLTPSYLLPQQSAPKFIGMLLAFYGVMVVKASFKHYSFLTFIGLKPEAQNPQLITTGILSKVRHPLYSGTILLVLGFWLFIPSIPNTINVGSILLYLAVGIPFEEKRLVQQYGQAYLDYKKRVPALVPSFKRRKR